jgi:ribonuclease I
MPMAAMKMQTLLATTCWGDWAKASTNREKMTLNRRDEKSIASTSPTIRTSLQSETLRAKMHRSIKQNKKRETSYFDEYILFFSWQVSCQFGKSVQSRKMA